MFTSPMRWAMEQDCAPATKKLVLVAVASHADDEGRGAYPSAVTLARLAACSPRMAQRHIAALKSEGLIEPGEQSCAGDLPGGRRPVVYDLAMPR